MTRQILHNAYSLRPMQLADIASVLDIGAQLYPANLYESADFYLNRLQLAASLCWVARNDAGVQGYLISYPWEYDTPPALNTNIKKLPQHANCWFIHDCAISPRCQGQGMATALLKQVEKVATHQQLAYSTLVALADALPFWLDKGYVSVEIKNSLTLQKVAAYGVGACYMSKKL